MPVVAIGVATDNDAGGKLWRALYRQPVAPPVTEVDDVPAAPCCAVRLEAGAVHSPDAMDWLGGPERCLAWAWLKQQ